MPHTQEMLRTHPLTIERPDALVRCIDECFDCAQVCITCADACLGEPTVANLIRCIRTNLDCAAVCQATGEILSRQVETNYELIRAQLSVCITACRICAEECEMHASHMEHCRVCAAACRRCEDACRQFLSML
jgi:hypothetical protein